LLDFLVFFRRKTVLANDLRSDGRSGRGCHMGKLYFRT
jgi:hypothetical protein